MPTSPPPQPTTAEPNATAPVKRVRARRGEGDRLREEILDAAEALLVESADAEAVSIRAISQIVGVTAPSIYRHFVDKDALVLAVCERAYDRFGTYLDEGAKKGNGPLEEIMGRAIAYLEFALDNPGQYRVLFMTPGNKKPDSDLSATPDATFSEAKGLVMMIDSVERAIAVGQIKPLASAAEMSIMLWTQVHGIASLRIAQPEMPWPTADAQIQLMFTTLANGMCANEAVTAMDHGPKLAKTRTRTRS
jgi:AcrR family transcriptional regulator